MVEYIEYLWRTMGNRYGIDMNWKRRLGITPALRNVGYRDLMILTTNNDLPTPLVFLRRTREREMDRASINFAIDISMKRQDCGSIKGVNLMVDDVHLCFVFNQTETLHVLFNDSRFPVKTKLTLMLYI